MISWWLDLLSGAEEAWEFFSHLRKILKWTNFHSNQILLIEPKGSENIFYTLIRKFKTEWVLFSFDKKTDLNWRFLYRLEWFNLLEDMPDLKSIWSGDLDMNLSCFTLDIEIFYGATTDKNILISSSCPITKLKILTLP